MDIPKAASLVAVAGFVAGCAQAPSAPTDSIDSKQVLLSFSKTRGPKIALGSISASDPSLRSIKCRGAGLVSPPGGVTYMKYIEQALIDQFTIAPGYAADSPIRLDAHLERIDFASLNPGRWEIEMTFRAPGVAPFKVGSVYQFPTSLNADVACPQVARALSGATYDLLARLVTHPSFQKLLAGAK